MKGTLTELARGKFVDDAAQISPDALATALGGLPPDKREPNDLLDMREAVKLMSAKGDWLDGFELDTEIIHGKR